MPIIYKSVNIWDWIGENFSKVWIEWDKGFHINKWGPPLITVQPGDDAVRHRCMLYGCRPLHGFNLIWFYLISPWLERYLKQIIFVTITAEQSPTSVSARSAPLGACRHRINYIPPFLWNYLCPGPGSGTDNWNSWAAGLRTWLLIEK